MRFFIVAKISISNRKNFKNQVKRREQNPGKLSNLTTPAIIWDLTNLKYMIEAGETSKIELRCSQPERRVSPRPSHVLQNLKDE